MVRYINLGEAHYQSPLLKMHDELLSLRQSPSRWVDVIVTANIATNVRETHVNDTPADYEDRGFESAVRLIEV